MKILVLSVDIPSKNKKGYQILSYHRIKYLAKQGHDITLISFGDKNCSSYKSDYEELKEQNIKIIPIKYIKILAPFKIFFALFNRKMPFQCAIYKSFRYQLVARKILKEFKPDIIYSIMLRPLSNINIKNKRIVFDIVDSLVVNFERRLLNANFLYKFLLKEELFRLCYFEEKLISKSIITIFVSSIDAEKYRKKYTDSIRIIPLGIKVKDKEIKEIKIKYDIIFSGNMNYQPNIDAVIWFYNNCWDLILKKLPNTTFVIAGRNPSREIKNLKDFNKNITVTGEVKSISDVISSSNISIAPMISGSGMQYKILESMSKGVPVIATEIGLGDLTSKIGRDILITNSPMEFADLIIKLLLDKNLSKKIGENGKKYVSENHSFKLLNEKFCEIVAQCDK